MELAASAAARPGVGRYRSQLFLRTCWLAVLTATATAALIAASGSYSAHPELVAMARALIVGLPLAVGLYAWSRRTCERFAVLLMVTGAALFVTALAESDDQLIYTVGRTAGWLVEVLLVYLLLSFPEGRLPERLDATLVRAMGAVVVVAFLPRLVLADDFQIPSPYTSCTEDCPPNALFLLDAQPAFVDAVLKPAGALLVVAVMVAVLLRLRDRMQDATPLARRLLVPVVVVGVARVALLALGFVLREADPSAVYVAFVSWSLALAVPAVSLAFLFTAFRWRLFAADALERFVERATAAPDVRALRRSVAEAFGDPMLEIAVPDVSAPGGWRDSAGRGVGSPTAGPDQMVSEVRRRGEVVAAIVHDRALATDPRLVEAATAMAAVVLDNTRLADEASTATREVHRSRARIAATAERERRRIERDLHDGAQQRLVALRIELELAEELVRRDPARGADRLHDLEQQVDEALDELRALAHGVYPPVLADQGLPEALLVATRGSPIRVHVEVDEVGRYTPEVESAVYFCLTEALQNVLKHAEGARRVTVRLDGGARDGLRFSVRDDGAGLETAIVAGAGITNMRDRLASVGGEVELSSARGVGTTVRGWVPSPAEQRL
jgi:signal transduction histidine kinase